MEVQRLLNLKRITSVVVLPPGSPGGEVFHPENPGGKSWWTGLASLFWLLEAVIVKKSLIIITGMTN